MKIYQILAICFFSLTIDAKDCSFQQSIYDTANEHFQNGQYLLSTTHYSLIKKNECHRLLQDKARYGYLLSIWKLEDTIELQRSFENIKLIQNKEIQQNAYLLKSYIDKKSDDNLTDKNRFKFSTWNQRFQKKEKIELGSLAYEYQQVRTKSPALAGTLSIIPGLGQIYNGSFEAAAISFILNTALAAATYEFFDNDQNAAGAVSSIIFSVTYIGNIISASNGASSINQSRFQALDSRYEEEYFGFSPKK